VVAEADAVPLAAVRPWLPTRNLTIE
jgi:hypothetical protein